MLGAIWQKLKTGLARTRDLFTGVAGLFRLKGRVDEAFLAELEKRLLSADMGALVSRDLVAQVRQSFLDREITGDVEAHVRQHLRSLLGDDDRSFHLAESGPTVILIAGVNGSGKTTSIAKLANRFHKEGKKVLVAACDTFRAAAVEQLALWAQRTGVEIVKGQTGADPASVAHDACVKAQAKGFDILIVDTAGRLHTQTHLMRELEKIQRILAKQIPGGYIHRKPFLSNAKWLFKKRLGHLAVDAAAVAGPGEGSVEERATWAALSRALLNLDETITKE